jgi:foldase protein PrsA
MNAFAALFLLISPVFAQSADRDIIKVNGTMIRQSEVMQKLWERYGPQTLDEMVDDLLLRQEVQAKKVAVKDEEVEKRVARLRAQFSDPKMFENQLAENGSSIEKLKKDISENLAREQMISAATHVKVDEAELKEAFDAHKDDLATPEGVHLRHLLVKSEAEANDAVKKIKGGADFKKLAAQISIAPTAKFGGDYGYVTKGMLPPEIEEIAFALKPNDIRILPSGKGYHVIQALERRPSAPAKFEAVKDDLREMILQNKIKAALPEYMAGLRKKAEIQPQGQ